MRVDLQPDPAAFVKQMADLRRFLNVEQAKGGQEAASARLLTACLIPYLNLLRTELRSEPHPPELMTALSDLVANMAMSLIQSMYDAPAEAQQEALDRIFGAAHGTATRMIENDDRMARDAAENAKPKLAIINGGKATTIDDEDDERIARET